MFAARLNRCTSLRHSGLQNRGVTANMGRMTQVLVYLAGRSLKVLSSHCGGCWEIVVKTSEEKGAQDAGIPTTSITSGRPFPPSRSIFIPLRNIQ